MQIDDYVVRQIVRCIGELSMLEDLDSNFNFEGSTDAKKVGEYIDRRRLEVLSRIVELSRGDDE